MGQKSCAALHNRSYILYFNRILQKWFILCKKSGYTGVRGVISKLLHKFSASKRAYVCVFVLFVLVLYMTGCGASGDALDQLASGSSGESAADSGGGAPAAKGSWDATPKIAAPEAAGSEVLADDKGLFTIDVSNKADGYFMVKYEGDNQSVKIQVKNSNGKQDYLYDLSPDKYGTYEVFSFPLGDGSYKIGAYESAPDGKYSRAVEEDVEVSISDQAKPFLYPIQNIYFTESSNAVKKASELAASANDEIGVIENIFKFVVDNVKYDETMAQKVINGEITAGYIPDPDRTLASLTGICYDYASLMGAMLRSQGIPAKMAVGYADGVYHAWLLVFSAETGTVSKVINFDGANWSLMDPTFSATSGQMADFVGSGTQYDQLYVY